MLREKTSSILLDHFKKYPLLDIQDIFKFLYQSTFGCEHMVTSETEAEKRICDEFKNVTNNCEDHIEELDGDYCRGSLSLLSDGITPKTLAKLFCLSSKKESALASELEIKIECARALIIEGALPLDLEAFDRELSKWKACGYPSIHHSDRFKKAYSPSYRVISKEYIPFLPLLTMIDKMLLRGKARIAIEGGSASGKSTLADILSNIYDCNVFHMDDFFLRAEQRTKARYAEIGGNIDRERFLPEVLFPLSKNEPFSYRPYDCSTFSLTEPINVYPKPLSVIEGVYSMHPEFRAFYDYSVYLNISDKAQKERINKRNSPDMANRFFNEWIPLENRYFNEFNIRDLCDLIIDIN